LFLHVHFSLVLPDVQCFLFAHLCYLFVVLLVPQCRCGGKEEAAGEHKGDERQTEEKEGMSLNGGTVAGGRLSGILVRLECRHSVDKKLSEVRRTSKLGARYSGF